jgi:hypothetical protein
MSKLKEFEGLLDEALKVLIADAIDRSAIIGDIGGTVINYLNSLSEQNVIVKAIEVDIKLNCPVCDTVWEVRNRTKAECPDCGISVDIDYHHLLEI